MTESKYLTLLIAGCRNGNEVSQLELYRHFYSYGLSICLRYARDRESALEMLNDGFLKVFLKIHQYKSEFDFKPWLRKVIVNAAIDHYRKHYQNQSTANLQDVPESATHNEALDQLEFDDLMKIMRLLPDGYRVVFNLFVIEGFTHAEIAKQLNISVGSSKSNLSKARRKIKELLSSSHDIHLKI